MNDNRTPQLETELASPENFNEIAYLLANLDVALEVMEGRIASAFGHFVEHGAAEGRRQIVTSVSDIDKDRQSIPASVPRSNIARHGNIRNLAKQLGGKCGMRVLEVGSRRVTGATSIRNEIEAQNGTYIGFDIYPGDNVDVVGDAHKLSDYIEGQVDLVYSSAVFEHLAMPWIVAEEIAKVLKVGGSLLIETHFSYSSHERPWHFFQFSDMGLKSLFSPALGFRSIEAGMCNPMVGRFSALADQYLKRRRINGLFCHSNIYAEKVRDVPSFSWKHAQISELVPDTAYPKPK